MRFALAGVGFLESSCNADTLICIQIILQGIDMTDETTTSEADDRTPSDDPPVAKKALKIDLAPEQRARFDRVKAQGRYGSQDDCLMALVDRALADPVDRQAAQIGQLNAWLYQLVRNDPKTRMSTAQREALCADIRRVVNHLCGWEPD